MITHGPCSPLSWFCRPARCPTYCQWANVGCHGISRKYAGGAAVLMMKCTQSQTRIDNKTQTGAEQLWPCSTACVASISVQSRGGVSTQSAYQGSFFPGEPGLFSVHGEKTHTRSAVNSFPIRSDGGGGVIWANWLRWITGAIHSPWPSARHWMIRSHHRQQGAEEIMRTGTVGRGLFLSFKQLRFLTVCKFLTENTCYFLSFLFCDSCV